MTKVRVLREEQHAQLCTAISEGVITSRAALESAIIERGWLILRRGDDYFTVQTIPGGRGRFRIRFDFGDATIEGWVYALVAFGGDQKVAGYVGCTTNFNERMLAHLAMAGKCRRAGKTSRELFHWAALHCTEVSVFVFQRVVGRCLLLSRERAWTDAARDAGWALPGAERWASRATRTVASSPGHRAVLAAFDRLDLRVARPLTEVVDLSLAPSVLQA